MTRPAQHRVGGCLLVGGWLVAWALTALLLLTAMSQLWEGPGDSLAASVLGTILLVGSGVLLAEGLRRKGGWSAAETWGLSRPAPRWMPWVGVALAPVPLGLFGSWLGAASWDLLQPLLPPWESSLDVIADALLSLSGPARIGFVAFVVLGGPLLEELLFRGFLWRGVGGDRRPLRALALTSLLFGAFHVHPEQAIGVLPLALFLGLLRWRSDSLLPCLFAHFLNNGFAVAALILGSGGDGEAAVPPELAAAALCVGGLASAMVLAGWRRPGRPEAPAPILLD